MRVRLAPRLAVALVLFAVVGHARAAEAELRWWVALGGQAALETGELGDVVGTEGGGLVGAGLYVLRLGPVLLGGEAEGSAGRLSADLGTVQDDVTVWRGRLGGIASWWPAETEPRLVPSLRLGAVYRADRGDFIEDEGFGWYVGLALDVTLGGGFALGPFVTYERTSLSLDAETWLIGLRLRFSR
jgi:hypothetical protein